MTYTRSQRPRLLVSVRNLSEARDALAGGCEILDVKEPAHGSLGMADEAVMREIAGGIDHRTTVSAALGETSDWRNCDRVPVLPAGVRYAKLGTAGLAATANWEREWQSVRARFAAAAEAPLQWVAVAYADWRRAAAPPPAEILEAAISGGCAGFLIDTFVKDGRSLFDAMSPAVIAGLRDAIRETTLLFALAGSLSVSDVSTAAALHPDIIAVRSAACRNGDRNAAVCRDSVRRLRETLADIPALRIDPVTG